MVRFLVLLAIVPFALSCEGDPQPSERSELEQAAYELQQLQNGIEQPAVHFRKHDRSLIDRMAWFREAIGTCDRFELYRDHGPKRALPLSLRAWSARGVDRPRRSRSREEAAHRCSRRGPAGRSA